LGGQGAPLVPVGDELLFSEYDACLNLGGIANISFRSKGKRVAFDICPVNMVLNHLAGKRNLDYDADGKLAAKGKFSNKLIKKFNAFPFYRKFGSKSLGREWVEKNFIASLEKEKLSVEDKLATISEHAAFQIARTLNQFKIKNVLITGGGAYNKDLLERISEYSDAKIILPSDKSIQFKEALIFAFLGVLRVRKEVNALKEVTGAKRSSCGGAIYL
jgi:anhydro-N-acetylmuramic acid kinase